MKYIKKLGITLILSVFLLTSRETAIAGNTLVFTQADTNNAANDLEIQLVSAVYDASSYTVKGTVENIGEETYKNIELQVIYTDQNGTTVLETETTLNSGKSLAPTEISDFEVSIGKNDAISAVTVNVLEAELAEVNSVPEGTIEIKDSIWQKDIGRYSSKFIKEIEVTPDGNYWLFTSNYSCIVYEGKTKIEVSDEEIKEVSVLGAFPIQPVEETGLVMEYSELATEKIEYSNDASFDFRQEVKEKYGRSFIVFYQVLDQNGKLVDEEIFRSLGKEGSAKLAYYEFAPKSSNLNYHFDILGVVELEDSGEKDILSCGDYSFSIDTLRCLGKMSFIGPHNSSGIAKIKISRIGEEDRYEILSFINGQGSVSTWDQHMETSNRDLYDFEILSYTPLPLTCNYRYIVGDKFTVKQKTFDEICEMYSYKYGVTIGDDRSYLSIDTNVYDLSNHDDTDDLKTVEEINNFFGFPDVLYQKMCMTTEDQGLQKTENDMTIVTWTNSPDEGLEVLYERKYPEKE